MKRVWSLLPRQFLFLCLCLCYCYAKQSREEVSEEVILEINEHANTWETLNNSPSNNSREELSLLLDLSVNSNPVNHDAITSNLADGEGHPGTPAKSYAGTIPESFDARKQWSFCPSIGNVYDEGACPSSYAFVVAPAFTDRLCIKTKGTHQTPISIEYLLSCCHACKHEDDNRKCGTGEPVTAWSFLNRRGVVTGGAYGSNVGCQPVSFPPCNRVFSVEGPACTDQSVPELRCHTRCTNKNYRVPYSADRHRGKKSYFVDTKVESIQREILDNGPASVQITVYEDFLHYKSGVYKHVKGERLEHQQTLKLIGWGEENGTPYWLCINSWGTSWGDQGTVKILRGKTECNFEYYVTAAVPRY